MHSGNQSREITVEYGSAIGQAIDFVLEAFGEDRVRLGPVPVPMYSHSLSVGLALQEYGCPVEIVIAGFLHDTLEDTDATATMIQRMFNARVRYLVEECSYDEKIGDTSAGIDDIHRRVIIAAENGDTGPLIVKIVDIANNLKTNANLPVKYQIPQYNRGIELLAAGSKYLPGHLMVDDLEITLEREQRRLGL